jgi:hypothetical protein
MGSFCCFAEIAAWFDDATADVPAEDLLLRFQLARPERDRILYALFRVWYYENVGPPDFTGMVGIPMKPISIPL